MLLIAWAQPDTERLEAKKCLPIYPVAPVTRMVRLVAARSADKSGLRKMLGWAKREAILKEDFQYRLLL